MTLNLSVDEVLTTTRSVRKRLDLEKPVPRKVLLECLELAIQAPTGSNAQGWQWVFVEDADKKKALADIYRKRRRVVSASCQRPNTPSGDIRAERMEGRHRLGGVSRRAPGRGSGADGAVPGGTRRRRAAAQCVVLGVTASRGVELHAGVCAPAGWARRGRHCTCSATARSRPPRCSASRSRSTARAGFSRSPTPRAPTSGRPSGCRSKTSCTGTAGRR